jgi:hypothetical protein
MAGVIQSLDLPSAGKWKERKGKGKGISSFWSFTSLATSLSLAVKLLQVKVLVVLRVGCSEVYWELACMGLPWSLRFESVDVSVQYWSLEHLSNAILDVKKVFFFGGGGGALHKNVRRKVFTFHGEGLCKNCLSQNGGAAICKKRSRTSILALYLADTSMFQWLLRFGLCNFDLALTATSAWQAQLYVNVDFSNRIGWRMIAKVDWNLRHWMHWCKCHYAVFQWKIWIGLNFLTLWNQPKPKELCLWSWMMIKCIM